MMSQKLTDAMLSDDKETKAWKARFSTAKAAYQEADFKTCESLLFRLLEQAKTLKESVFAVNTTKISMGVLCLANGKVEEAETQLSAVITALAGSGDQALKELHAVALRFHSNALVEAGNEERAEQELDQAIQILEKVGISSAVQLAYALSDLGALKVRQGKLDEAKDYIFNALDLLETTIGPEHRAYMKAEVIYNLCHAESQDKFLDGVEDGILKMQYQYGHKHPDIVGALRRYAKARLDRGESEKLAEAKEKFPMLEKILKL